MTRRKPNDDAPQQRTASSALALYVLFDHRPWFLALVLAVVTFAAYQPTWHVGCIGDDDDHRNTNPALGAPDR